MRSPLSCEYTNAEQGYAEAREENNSREKWLIESEGRRNIIGQVCGCEYETTARQRQRVICRLTAERVYTKQAISPYPYKLSTAGPVTGCMPRQDTATKDR